MNNLSDLLHFTCLSFTLQNYVCAKVNTEGCFLRPVKKPTY